VGRLTHVKGVLHSFARRVEDAATHLPVLAFGEPEGI
jgi:hypothetical protein